MSKSKKQNDKRLSVVQAKTGLSVTELVTGIKCGAIEVGIGPRYLAYVKERRKRKGSDKPALTKAQAQKIVSKKFGDGHYCANPIDIPYIFVVMRKFDGATIGLGPSWEMAIKDAESNMEKAQ